MRVTKTCCTRLSTIGSGMNKMMTILKKYYIFINYYMSMICIRKPVCGIKMLQ